MKKKLRTNLFQSHKIIIFEENNKIKENMENPKLFISYCWTNQEHESWVLNLATELVENGVDVIIDKWNLREGQDSYKFMEQMVNNKDIKKVLLICNKKYAERANNRDGGVGTETQIISKEVYTNSEQEKFVAATLEKDEAGQPYLPTYYNPRIYIDFSEPDNYTESFEKLLRWIYDKPLYKRPPLGKKPSFLDEEDSISLNTSFLYKRVISGLKESKQYTNGAIDEYLNVLAENIELLRINIKTPEEYDDKLIEKIETFLPYRNEFINICYTICQYSTNMNTDRFHRFFESLISYFEIKGSGIHYEMENDVFKFVAYELFLYYIAILIKYEKFSDIDDFLYKGYIQNKNINGRIIPGYLVFYENLKSLIYRSRRLDLSYLSLYSNLIKERAKHVKKICFEDLMQADFILFLRSEHLYNEPYRRWYPQTLIYSEYQLSPFEIFYRSESLKYFDKIKVAISFEDVNEFKAFIDKYYTGEKNIPSWQFCQINPKILANYERIGTIK